MVLVSCSILAVYCLWHTALATADPIQIPAETLVVLDSDVQPENLIMRPNDHLLVTSASVPHLMQIDPFAGPNQTVRIVARFGGYASTTGIVQLQPDIFAIGVGNYSGSIPPHGVAGTWHIVVVDLREYQWPHFDPNRVRIRDQIGAPQISDIDGLALINSHRGFLAAADFTSGIIWHINIQTREVQVLAQDPQLAPITPFEPSNPDAYNQTNPTASIGVNGLKFKDAALYFTDFAKGLYGSIPVNPKNGSSTGFVETIFAYEHHLDDIALSSSGNTYLTTYDAPGLGVLRRKAGTLSVEDGTDLVIQIPGANAVLPQQTFHGCTLYITKALPPYSIMKAEFEGLC